MRFLLYLILFVILFRLVGTLIRMWLATSAKDRDTRKPRNSNVNVNRKDTERSKGYKGGEYVDYEEVD